MASRLTKQIMIMAAAWFVLPWIGGALFWLGHAVIGGLVGFLAAMSIALPAVLIIISTAVTLMERYE